MRVALLTREYPPDVYGGAGVHVEQLSLQLAELVEVSVHRWASPAGDRRAAAGAPTGSISVCDHRAWEALEGDAPELAALRAVSIDLTMAAAVADADVVHSHTWYAQFGGHLAKLVHGVPHVATVHSLEPRRPWKAEQLGGGYALSRFCERTALEGADAVIAVSEASLNDILEAYPAIDPAVVHVVHNGIDTERWAPDHGTEALERNGIDPRRPSVLFVGRITRQKGVDLLLRAAESLAPDAQLILCAGEPDTEQLSLQVRRAVERLKESRDGVVWIQRMLGRAELVQLLTHATVFACPSIYEPMGIVNLEAMACETAVVASDTGGIPEVVLDGETGLLVALEPGSEDMGPADPDAFAAELAAALNELLRDPDRAAEMGRAGRRRAVERFGWPQAARRTVEIYERVLGERD
ncbi:MAG TPA: glycogen synthase [Solirubrobacteraceae bacterium]|nr:glycogen synthase [Solirubrobacteraceae bacterium]